MRYIYNLNYYGKYQRNTNIYGGGSNLRWCYFNTTANHFQQWHHWFLGTGFGQHDYNYLYIYAGSRSMRYIYNLNYYGKYQRDTNIYGGGSNLCWCYFNATANHF
jgi:hypothetical protein